MSEVKPSDLGNLLSGKTIKTIKSGDPNSFEIITTDGCILHAYSGIYGLGIFFEYPKLKKKKDI